MKLFFCTAELVNKGSITEMFAGCELAKYHAASHNRRLPGMGIFIVSDSITYHFYAETAEGEKELCFWKSAVLCTFTLASKIFGQDR